MSDQAEFLDPPLRVHFVLRRKIGLRLPHWGHGLAVLAAAAFGVAVLGSTASVPERAIASTPKVAAIATAHPLPGFSAPLIGGTTATLPLTLTEAQAANAAMPVSTLPNMPALPFLLTAAAQADADRALDCLASAVYYEAASESIQGQRAVAQVVLNRLRHPAFPKTVCGVVFEGAWRAGAGCQFSFTCDGALARGRSTAGFDLARRIAAAALAGYVEPSVGLATHYHTVDVVPFWRDSLAKVAVVGAHIFYRWNGANGELRAFTGRYAGREPMPSVAAAAGALPSLDAAVTTVTVHLGKTAKKIVEVPGLATDMSGLESIEKGPRLYAAPTLTVETEVECPVGECGPAPLAAADTAVTGG